MSGESGRWPLRRGRRPWRAMAMPGGKGEGRQAWNWRAGAGLIVGSRGARLLHSEHLLFRKKYPMNSRPNASFAALASRPASRASAPQCRASSLVHSLSGSSWGHTMTDELDMLGPPVNFREPLRGVTAQEVNDPQVFLLYFG